MEINGMNMPGYRYAEYMLVLNPHQDLRNRIINLKKDFSEAYGGGAANTGGRPHVMLAKFVVWQMMEEKIVNRLKVTAMATAPFKVTLKDFGSFPTHSIFINVTTKLPIQKLVKDIKSGQRLMKSPDNDPYFVNEPFIAVVRKLNAKQYENAWLEYAHRNFSGSFIADGMLLLKRKEGDKGYQIVQRMEFMNLPVSTKQGELFM